MIVGQFVQGDDLGSKAIQAFERGWPSHVDIVHPDGRLFGARSDVVGGAPAGVHFRTADYAIWSRVERASLLATADEETAFWNFLMAQEGKPYDMVAIAAFAGGIFLPAARNWRDPGHWFCSELFTAAVEASGWFKHKLSDVTNHITPRDALLLVSGWDASPVT